MKTFMYVLMTLVGSLCFADIKTLTCAPPKQSESRSVMFGIKRTKIIVNTESDAVSFEPTEPKRSSVTATLAPELGEGKTKVFKLRSIPDDETKGSAYISLDSSILSGPYGGKMQVMHKSDDGKKNFSFASYDCHVLSVRRPLKDRPAPSEPGAK